MTGQPTTNSKLHIRPVHAVVALCVAVAIVVASINASSAAFLIDPPPGDPPVKIYVATGGKDTNDGLTPRTSVRSVRRALELKGNKIIFVGPTYQLPLAQEHKAGSGLQLNKSILLVSNQTPWEQSPSSSKGGYTEILPARNPDGTVNIDHRFLKFQAPTGYTIGQLSSPAVMVKFLKFQNTELWGQGLGSVRYQGD